MSGMINVVVLFLLAGYLNGFWHVGLLQVGLYILTPYLLSGMIALGILSMETGKKHSFLFVISLAFDVHWLWCHRGYSGHYVYGS